MKDYRPYLELLRFVLNGDNEVPDSVSTIDWDDLYQFARKQGLVGVYYHGIKRLPLGQGPTPRLLMRWVGEAEMIRRANAQANRAAAEATMHFERAGFDALILKGQGNAQMYPAPAMRTPGDVDIMVVPREDAKQAYPHDEAEDVVMAHCRARLNGRDHFYHHIHIDPIAGAEVEVHFRPSFRQNLIHNARLQRWYVENLAAQFKHRIVINKQDNECIFSVPTVGFNLIYQLTHLSTHFMQEGIGLRQLVDYYVLLLRADEVERADAGREVMRLGLDGFAAAVMWVLGEALGLSRDRMITPPCPSFGRMMLNEALMVGNFGQHDSRVAQWRKQTQIGRNIQRLMRDVSLLKYYPSEALSEPVFRIYHFFWRLKHRG